MRNWNKKQHLHEGVRKDLQARSDGKFFQTKVHRSADAELE